MESKQCSLETKLMKKKVFKYYANKKTCQCEGGMPPLTCKQKVNNVHLKPSEINEKKF